MTSLDEAITPADAVAKLKARNIDISERTLRERARRLGACRVIGKTLFLLPSDIDTILNAAKPEPAPQCPTSTSEKAATSGTTVSRWTENDTENLLKRVTGGSRKTSRASTKPASVVQLSTARRQS